MRYFYLYLYGGVYIDLDVPTSTSNLTQGYPQGSHTIHYTCKGYPLTICYL